VEITLVIIAVAKKVHLKSFGYKTDYPLGNSHELKQTKLNSL